MVSSHFLILKTKMHSSNLISKLLLHILSDIVSYLRSVLSVELFLASS